jgi:hypothetical protein
MTELLNGSPQIAAYRLPVAKFGVGTVVEVCLRTPALVCFATHWLGGRTLLCADDAGICPGCEANQARMTGYTIGCVRNRAGQRTSLLEFAGAGAVDFAMGLPDPLVGTLIECIRRASRHRVEYRRLGRQAEMFNDEVPGFRLLQALSVLFDIPLPRAGGSPADWMAASLERRLALLQAAARRE